MNQFMLIWETESRYKKKLKTEFCFHLHKILDSVSENLGTTPHRDIYPCSLTNFPANSLQILRYFTNIAYKLCIHKLDTN